MPRRLALVLIRMEARTYVYMGTTETGRKAKTFITYVFNHSLWGNVKRDGKSELYVRYVWSKKPEMVEGSKEEKVKWLFLALKDPFSWKLQLCLCVRILGVSLLFH